SGFWFIQLVDQQTGKTVGSPIDALEMETKEIERAIQSRIQEYLPQIAPESGRLSDNRIVAAVLGPTHQKVFMEAAEQIYQHRQLENVGFDNPSSYASLQEPETH